FSLGAAGPNSLIKSMEGNAVDTLLVGCGWKTHDVNPNGVWKYKKGINSLIWVRTRYHDFELFIITDSLSHNNASLKWSVSNNLHEAGFIRSCGCVCKLFAGLYCNKA
ncbi:hypothetical protein ACFL6Z_05040, partial [Pseudomonadota bacterium]